MRRLLFIISILFTLCSASLGAEITLKGTLVTDSKEPVPGTRIGVAGGPSDKTDANGSFQIKLASDFIEGERVIISVFKENWVINHPLDGEWNLPNIKYQHEHTSTVIIVPRGSKALWTHERIEKHIGQLSDELARVKKEGDRPKPVDLGHYLQGWAEKYGFSPHQVKEQFDGWAAAVKDSTDHRTLGLRAFYLKNFSGTSDHFTKAAQNGEERRKALKERLRQEDLATYKNWKDAGNSLYAAYEFKGALGKYRRAEKITAKEEYPRQWPEIQLLIGNCESEHGIRVKGEESSMLLSAAVASYQRALEVYTKADMPQKWAATQNNLGNALAEQGIRTAGEEGARLLAQAEAAYRMTLEVRTFEHLPEDWAQTQNNLADLYEKQENWPAAIECYRHVYKIYPDYAAGKLAVLYHDRVFQFENALEMNLYLIAQEPLHPTALIRLVENYFTAARFTDGNQHIAKLKPVFSDGSSPPILVFLMIYEIANAIGLDLSDTSAIQLDKLIALVEKQEQGFNVGWDFTGSKHFVRNHQALAPQREWLLSFFAALEQPDRDAIIKELKSLRLRTI